MVYSAIKYKYKFSKNIITLNFDESDLFFPDLTFMGFTLTGLWQPGRDVKNVTKVGLRWY